MSKGFQRGDPRAVAAGRKGGRTMRTLTRTPDWWRGYKAGWIAAKRALSSPDALQAGIERSLEDFNDGWDARERWDADNPRARAGAGSPAPK